MLKALLLLVAVPLLAQVNPASPSAVALSVTNGGTGTATAFTQGSVVFAGASGVYSQDNASFSYDATNHRLTALKIIGDSTVPNISLSVAGGAGISYGSTFLSIGNGTISFSGGNVLFGGFTNGNYQVDVQKSGSTGTARCWDQTASTGSTLCVVQAGAGNAASDKVLDIKSNGGTDLMWHTADGNVVITPQKSTTGQRYVCIDTTGKLVSSAAACVGT